MRRSSVAYGHQTFGAYGFCRKYQETDMKCTGISTGSSSSNSLTLEQFTESEYSETPLGKLLSALAGEAVWSNDYTVYASFGSGKPFLQVNHRTFLSEESLMIYDDAKTVLSVHGVEDGVRMHIKNSQNGIRPVINMLQNRVNDLGRVSDKIMWDKARAAIVAAFPQAADATPSNVGSGVDLYAFSASHHAGPVFVARAVGGEFTGGSACVWCNSFGWFSAGDGIEKGQRHHLFWKALARAFVARELISIREESLSCAEVFASENPWDEQRLERFTVEKVTFSDRKGEIVVEFGSDNLPATVTVLPITQEEPAAST